MVVSGVPVSTVNVTLVGALVLPAASMSVAEMVLLPSGKLIPGVQLQLPPVATTVQSVALPLVTVTVLPAGAIPVIVGVLVLTT